MSLRRRTSLFLFQTDPPRATLLRPLLFVLLLPLRHRLVGLDAKLAQYAQGEAFIAAIESVGGPELLARVWEDPIHLPDLAEIREPDLWLGRIAQTTHVNL